ncbi:Holliday junction branch migration protein RuvA [Candidatus Bipolaricaulota sp. J31]
MFEFLEGEVVAKGEEAVVLQVGGVGFRLAVPKRTVGELGGFVKLYTHLLVSEDELSLYGFATPEERDMFVGLLSVPQLGPRLAFRLVAAMPPEEFVAAIRRGDLSALEQVKGIGRRTAQRIMVELSERLAKVVPAAPTPLSEKETVVLRALTSKALGFSEAEARKALETIRRECPPDAPVEEMIKRALQILSTR